MQSSTHTPEVKRRRDGLNHRNEKYNTTKIKLESKGDVLLLYTDGLTDHLSVSRDAFMDMQDRNIIKPEDEWRYHFVQARLKDILFETRDYSAKDTFYKIKDEIRNFGPQEDDISYVIIKKK
jgi:serine phosphatase RsbU (regulator of sigma subunit)